MIVALFLAAIFAYVAFAASLVYLCVFADPDQSPWARYLSQTLPARARSAVERYLGPRTLKVVEFWTDRLLILLYCAVVFGAWSVVFFYVYPWIDRHPAYVSQYHKLVGYVVFMACVLTWRAASTSSPGIVTATTLHRYQHYPYDNLLFVPQRCKTRNIPRPARSKFDRIKYHQNVPRYDHFCGWVYNTIGEENYRWFLLFLLVHVMMCSYGAYITGKLFYGEIVSQNLHVAVFVDRFTGEEIRADRYIIGQYLFNKFPFESAILLLMAVMAVFLGAFLGYHAYMTSRNFTTNEAQKWGQVNKWYKRELKRYKEAVKNGQQQQQQPQNENGDSSTKKEEPSIPSVTVSDDGDVNCTGGGGATDKVVVNDVDGNGDVDDPTVARHPGPKPTNLYDRGFVENWKEVVFPISLRTDQSIACDAWPDRNKAKHS